MKRIFLGGTCAGTTWRDDLIPLITGFCDYFNPVVPSWTAVNKIIEDIEKDSKCTIHLYVLTSSMIGVYSVAEAIQSSHQPGVTTVVQVMPEGFSDKEIHSLNATLELLKCNGATTRVSGDLCGLAEILKHF